MQSVGQTLERVETADRRSAPARARTRLRQFHLQTIWDFDASTAELIAVALDIDRIPEWCGHIFMDIQTVCDRRSQPGHRIFAHTKGFLPHSFVFAGTVTEHVPSHVMKVAIDGDFEGMAKIEVLPHANNARLLFTWRIDCRHRLIVALCRLAPALMVWNHKWAMRRACKALQRELNRRRSGSNLAPSRAEPTFPHNFPLMRSVFAYRRRTNITARG